jgi:ATP-dependent protease ClpP protease subunit
MYGEVVESIPVDFWTGEPIDGLYIVLKDFLSELDRIQSGSKVTLRINSPGGDLEAGIAIYNRLRMVDDLTTIGDGIAASAASLIAQAGKTRRVYQNSEMMIHGAFLFISGWHNLGDLQSASKQLEAANEQVIQTYAERTGRDRIKLKHMIESTTWMTGQEIVDQGFADEVIPGNLQMSMSERFVISNSLRMDRRRFLTAPPIESRAEETEITDTENNNPEKEVKPMTLDELKASEPDLVNQIEENMRASIQTETSEIEARAMAAERERIREIESIEASIADKDLIQAAKYGENPMNARDLAFAAMQKQAKIGNVMLKYLQSDAAESGASYVGIVPAAEDSATNQREQDAAAIQAAVKALFGKEA